MNAANAQTHPIEAVAKTRQGKGASRELRRTGYIPAIVYGGEKSEPLAVGLKTHDVMKALRIGHFFTHKQELKLDGKIIQVLPREIQRHPVTDQPMHIDFMAYKASQQVHANVAVRITGEDECPGLKEGGVLQLVEAEIEVICRADSIPEEVVVSIAGLEIGEGVHLSSVTLPEGVKPAVTDRDLTILTIISTRTSATAEDEAADAATAAEAAAEGAEGEAKKEGAAKEEEKKDEGEKKE